MGARGAERGEVLLLRLCLEETKIQGLPETAGSSFDRGGMEPTTKDWPFGRSSDRCV
jgi:hypothetical protein